MAETRKVFPIQTFVSLLRGKPGAYSNDVLELLSFVTNKSVDKEFAPFAASLAKAWIYEQHPELARAKKEEVTELGENVSVMTFPPDMQEEVDAIFDQLQEQKQTLKQQKDSIAEYEGTLEENKKKIASLESKVQDYEAQAQEEGEKKIMASASKVDDYLKKVDDLLAKIEEVKKHGVVTVSGEGGAAAGGAEAAGGGGTGEPEEDFGFGGSAGPAEGDFGF
jgi:predicted ribosome quality control (RQC) complex YloA/Tae2 family protein